MKLKLNIRGDDTSVNITIKIIPDQNNRFISLIKERFPDFNFTKYQLLKNILNQAIK